jgi:hypothetical protein
MDRCDVIDVLEASAKLRRTVTVELKNGHKFVDQAKDVVTEPDSPEWVRFRDHDRVIVDDIVFCTPADPPVVSTCTCRGSRPTRVSSLLTFVVIQAS